MPTLIPGCEKNLFVEGICFSTEAAKTTSLLTGERGETVCPMSHRGGRHNRAPGGPSTRCDRHPTVGAFCPHPQGEDPQEGSSCCPAAEVGPALPAALEPTQIPQRPGRPAPREPRCQDKATGTLAKSGPTNLSTERKPNQITTPPPPPAPSDEGRGVSFLSLFLFIFKPQGMWK